MTCHSAADELTLGTPGEGPQVPGASEEFVYAIRRRPRLDISDLEYLQAILLTNHFLCRNEPVNVAQASKTHKTNASL